VRSAMERAVLPKTLKACHRELRGYSLRITH
jgi:hypothetical protein